MLEHPAITNTIRTGYPDGEPRWPRCPICGQECKTIFWKETEVVGCDECLEQQRAWDYQEDFED